MDFTKLSNFLSQYTVIAPAIAYGTAGFRAKSDKLPSIFARMGILAGLRSIVKKSYIGVMVTASHNPEGDNGIKIVDPSGEMLEISWERIATELGNIENGKVADYINTLDIPIENNAPFIVIGYDTRKSSPSLVKCVKDGLAIFSKTNILDLGVITTPQLHFVTRCMNFPSYGKPTTEGYFEKISSAFLHLFNLKGTCSTYLSEVQVDCSNGVGAIALDHLMKLQGVLKISVFNKGGGILNFQCGADYVKTHQCLPENMPAPALQKCCSFDGDADRIVYFYVNDKGHFRLLDGDKLATLIAAFIQGLLQESQLALSMGLVQTAYANGSSTAYISNELKVPVACVPTGVKHLHAKARMFDIGVYFEANGHGTALYSDKAVIEIQHNADDGSLPENVRKAAQKLLLFRDMTNETVGDALSDMLLVETVLSQNDWSVEDWDNCYEDLPNRQMKVHVQDRTVISTFDAERKVEKPAGLQDAVDKLVAGFDKARSFVRPSGTEDIVRVYAEADTQRNADLLAVKVAEQVYNFANGVGDLPTI